MKKKKQAFATIYNAPDSAALFCVEHIIDPDEKWLKEGDLESSAFHWNAVIQK